MTERDYLTCAESDDLRPADYTANYQFHGHGENIAASFPIGGRRSLHDRRDENGCTHWVEPWDHDPTTTDVQDLARDACRAIDAIAVEDLTDATLRDVHAATSNFVTDAIVEERRRGIDFDTMEAT